MITEKGVKVLLYLLLSWFIALFFISYYLTGKDFFTPSTMMSISFAFACSLSIYILSNLTYSYSLQAVLLIGSCVTLTVVINMFVHGVFQHVYIRPVQGRATPIPGGFTVVALLIAAVVIFAQLREITRVAGSAGAFGQIMIVYRNRHGYSTDLDAQYPFWLRQLMHLMQALFILYAFNLIKFFRILKRREIVFQLLFLGLMVLSSLLTSGRFDVLSNMIACVFMFHMVRIQRLGRYRTYKFGFVVRVVLLVMAAAWFFYWIKEFAGRVSEDTLFDYTAHYLGTGIINFDLYLKNPPMPSNIWGKETFYALLNVLRRLGIADFESYIYHKEFRSIAGVGTGNIYTALRACHYDFGVAGMYILHTLFSLFYALCYEYTKKKRSNLSIVYFGQIYYCTILYMYNDFFYSNIVSVGFAIKCVMIYVLYKLLIEKRVRFRGVRAVRGQRFHAVHE